MGVRIGLRYTFFFLQKHGLKSKIAQYCTLKALFLFFFGFSLHFPQNRGGSDPSVKNFTLFFFLNEGFPKDGSFFPQIFN